MNIEKVCYILGNGFDKAHGLKTGYLDYRQFLKNNYDKHLKDYEKFDYCLDLKSDKWTDLETALTFDFDKMNELIEDDELESSIQFIFDFTGKLFLEWLCSINYCGMLKKVDLRKESRYITFNYTEVLENVYEIPEENIFHIHGKISSVDFMSFCKDDIILTKHLSMRNQEDFEVAEIQPHYKINNDIVREHIQFGTPYNKHSYFDEIIKKRDEALDYGTIKVGAIEGYIPAAEYCEATYKDISKNYKLFREFLEEDITKIVVMGHSILGVDELYYQNILIPLLKDKNWEFYYYSEEDKQNIIAFIGKYQLQFASYHKVDDFLVMRSQ